MLTLGGQSNFWHSASADALVVRMLRTGTVFYICRMPFTEMDGHACHDEQPYARRPEYCNVGDDHQKLHVQHNGQMDRTHRVHSDGECHRPHFRCIGERIAPCNMTPYTECDQKRNPPGTEHPEK